MIQSTAGQGHGANASKHLVKPIKTKTETLFEAWRLSAVEEYWCCPVVDPMGNEVTSTHDVPCAFPLAVGRLYPVGHAACRGCVCTTHTHACDDDISHPEVMA